MIKLEAWQESAVWVDNFYCSARRGGSFPVNVRSGDLSVLDYRRDRALLADIRGKMGDERFWRYAGSVGIDADALAMLGGEALGRFLAGLRAEVAA